MQDIKLKKRLTIELPQQKHAEIKAAAAYLGISMVAFIDKAVQEKIQREMKEKK